jgi:hypothetical protein
LEAGSAVRHGEYWSLAIRHWSMVISDLTDAG